MESHNKVIKQDILKSSNMKPSRVIKSLRCDVLASLVKVHASPKFKKMGKKSHIPDPQEKFKGGKPLKITNFDWANRTGSKFFMNPQLFDMKKVNEIIESFDQKYRNAFFSLSILDAKILKNDVAKLSPGEMLNDQIIFAYLSLLSASVLPSKLMVTDFNFVRKIESCGGIASSSISESKKNSRASQGYFPSV